MSNKKISKKYYLMVGRFQPPHAGHFALIRTLLDEGKNVLIGMRETGINGSNPYDYGQRIGFFLKEFMDEYFERRVAFISLDCDIEGIVYGRKVGYEIREIHLDEKTESISATKIRKQNETTKNKN